MQCSNCGNELPTGVRFCPKCGNAVAPATSQIANAQPTVSFGGAQPSSAQPSSPQPLSGGGMVQGGKKSGCGKALVILLIIGVILLGVVGGGLYYGYKVLGDKLKSSEAYMVAISTLKGNTTVADKMGTIKDTGFPIGSFHEETGGTGEAAYHMSVTGTKTTGTYDVVMLRRGGKWYLTTGNVTLASGEVIKLRSPELDNRNTDPANSNSSDTDAPPPLAPGRAGKNVISSGALDERAINKPAPAYPAVAKAVDASGKVVVQVTVDEQGQVVSAHAVSGHPLLRASAEAAARQARFTPTLLSGRPVKVTGTLTYDIEPQQ
jgi:TonB family protein